MSTFFLFLYRFFNKHKLLFWLTILTTFSISIYFAIQIRLEEDLTKFIPKNASIDKVTYVFQNFKFKDKLVVNVYLADSTKVKPEKLISFANNLAEELKKQYQPDYIKEISYKVSDDVMKDSYESFYANLPYFLDEKDYAYLDSVQSEKQIESRVKSIYKLLISPAGFALKDFMLKDPLNIGLLALNKIKSIDLDENYEIYDGYIFTKNKKNILLFITSANSANETSKNAKLIDGLDKTIEEFCNNGKNSIKAEYFGGIAVGVSNAKQLKEDSMITTSLAVILIVIILGFFFRKKRVMGLILIPVIFGVAFSLAILYLMQGTISAIALGAGSVILGIAINYSLHVFTHFKHTQSAEEVIKDLSEPLTIGSATTIGAFLCLLFVNSEALKDFGLFSAFSLIGAALFSLIVLPHFLIKEPEIKEVKKKIKFSIFEKLSEYKLENNKYVIIGLFIVLGICFVTAWDVKFESDMTAINYFPDKIANAENNLNKISDNKLKSIYLVSTGKDLKEAIKNSTFLNKDLERLKSEGIIKTFASINTILIPDSLQNIKLKRWNNYWTLERRQTLQKKLIAAGNNYKFKETAFEKFYLFINKQFKPIDNASFDSINKLFLDSWITKTPDLTMVATIVKAETKDKQVILNTFSNNSNVVVFDKQFLASKFVDVINNDFNLILLLSSLLVFVFLVISYGRIELGIIAFVPMLLSWILILGLMSIFGIKFNIINIIISTFIFGLGDDYSIFIMDGLLEEYKTGKKTLASYKTSVYLSAFTTIVGLGVLLFAKHPALKSIALITIIGMFSVVLISNTIVPLLFKWLIYKKKKRRAQPVTFYILIYAIVCYTYYLVGCLFVFISGFLIKLIPIGKKNQQYIYHLLLMYSNRSVMFIMFFAKKRVINKKNIDFKKPHIIICNHQSIIDIPLVLTFTPKLIVLTTNWVWNSPIVGKIVRTADFYNVTSGLDKLIPFLQEKVNDGYSILVFPEGTRSENKKIKRFHKGAFYLAEKLKLDIVPVIINGTADYVSKGELLGKKSTITVKYLNPIPLSDISFGDNYSARAKAICDYFRAEHESLLQEYYRKPAYFKSKLLKNYVYKGPIIEWYLKVKLRLEKNYTFYQNLIPPKASIVDIGCGYGFLSYMLAFLSENRKITGIDFDENKIAIANNCKEKNDNINLYHGNALDYNYNKSDVFILSDVLHYLPENQQEQLILKCIENLNSHGMIIIRDADNELGKRHIGTRITEFFSTKFGFNKTLDNNKHLYFVSRSTINNIIIKYSGLQMDVIDNSKFTSNIFYIIKKIA